MNGDSVDYFDTFNTLSQTWLSEGRQVFASQGASILYEKSGSDCEANSTHSHGNWCRCDEGYRVNANRDGCELIPAPPPPPTLFCKSFLGGDGATRDLSGFDPNTSTTVGMQPLSSGIVGANVYDCYHWSLTAQEVSNISAWSVNGLKAGDIIGVVIWQIPYTNCSSSTTYHTWIAQKIAFNQASDGTWTEAHSTHTAFQPMLIGSNDPRYSQATLTTLGGIQVIGGQYPNVRITTSQRNTIINSIVADMDGYFGSHIQEPTHVDCFMVNRAPARWVNPDEWSAGRGILWSSEADVCKCGCCSPMRVSIVWEELKVGTHDSTSGRYTAYTNCVGRWTDSTSEISPNADGTYSKSLLSSELEDLKTRSLNWLANCDRQEIQETEEARERIESEKECDLGYVETGRCPENSYKQYGGGGLFSIGRRCYRCACDSDYVSANYEKSSDTYLATPDSQSDTPECFLYDCMDNSYYDAALESCVCLKGYEMNTDGTECDAKSLPLNSDGECPTHTTQGDDGKCYCNAGYHAAGEECVADENGGNGNGEIWDVEEHLNQYGMWYGLAFIGFVALKAFKPSGGV